jgi:tetratricopeptide (TPR) repeat protein
MRLRTSTVAILALSIALQARAESVDVDESKPDEDARRIGGAAALARQHKYNEALQLLDAKTFGAELERSSLLIKAQIMELALMESWPVYEIALKKYPDDPAVNLRAGVSKYWRGSGAELLLRRSWRAAPMPETAYYLGRIYFQLGRSRLASEFFAQCIALEQTRGTWRQAAEEALQALVAGKRLPGEPR